MGKAKGFLRTLPPIRSSDTATGSNAELDRIKKLRRDAKAPEYESDNGSPAANSDPISSRGRDSADPEAEPPSDSGEKNPPDPTPVPAAIDTTVLIEKLSNFLTVINQKDQEKKELESKLAEAQKLADAAKAEAEAARSAAELAKADATAKIEQLFKVAGVSPGGAGSVADKSVNFNTQGSSDKITGSAADFEKLYDSAPTFRHQTQAGNYVYVKDSQIIDQFVRENRDHLRKDMEALARRNGLLQGGNGRVTQKADTVKVNIPDMFLSYLSSIVRQTHLPSFIWHQFVPVRLDHAKGQGDTIVIPRWNYQPTATAPNDRLLSGAGTYVRITSDRQNLSQASLSSVILEFGLGKDTNARPILIPEFVSAYSLQDLESVLVRNLGYDYNSWEDLYIRSAYDQTSVVWYNDNGNIATSPSSLTTGDDGRFTTDFLDAAYSEMRALQIPPMDDGCYMGAINTFAAQTFKKSFEGDSAKWQAANTATLQELTNMLNYMNGGWIEKVSGYLGKFNNFHLFESNAWGLGNAGTPGAQSETFGSGIGAQTSRTSYLFGRDAVGRGIGQPMEIRMDEMRDFGRSDSYIWRSEEVVTTLDVDPVGTGRANEQLRVIEVRTLRNAA